MLLPEKTTGDRDGCAGHTQSLRFLLTALTTLFPFLPWADLSQVFNALSSSVSEVQGKIFSKSESLSASVARSILDPASPPDWFFSAHLFLELLMK